MVRYGERGASVRMKIDPKYALRIFSAFITGAGLVFTIATQLLMPPSDMLRWVTSKESISNKINRVFSPINQEYRDQFVKIESLNSQITTLNRQSKIANNRIEELKRSLGQSEQKKAEYSAALARSEKINTDLIGKHKILLKKDNPKKNKAHPEPIQSPIPLFPAKDCDVTLVIPAKFSGANVFVDDNPAVIIKQTPLTITIQVKKSSTPYKIQVKKGEKSCTIHQLVSYSLRLQPCQ